MKSLPYTFYSFLAHVHSLNLFLKHWTQSHAIDFSHQGRAFPLENIKAYETVEKAQNIRIYFLNGYFATCMRIMVQFLFSYWAYTKLCSMVGPRPALALHRGTFSTA